MTKLFIDLNLQSDMTDDLIEKLGRIPQFYLVKANHSRDRIAFYWDITGRIELYVMDLETKEYEQISHGEVPRALRSGFIWTRDNNSILFAKDKDGNEQHDLYSFNVETKEIIQLTDTPTFQEHVLDTSPDGKNMLFLSTRNGQMNAFTRNFDTGEVKELTNFQRPVFGAKWSPKNNYIVFGYNDSKKLQNMDIWIMDVDGSNQRKLLSLEDGSQDGVVDISEDGKIIAISSDYEGIIKSGIYNLDKQETKWFGDGSTEEYAAAISKDGRFLVTIRNYKATVSPVIYNVETGQEKTLKLPPGISSGTELIDNDEQLILTLNTSTSPSSLVKYHLRNNTFEELIPVQLGDIEADFFVEDEYIEYESTDGLTIGAILYKPKNTEIGKKLPALVQVHGGPTGQYYRNFSMFDQILIHNGFVILKPNFRGSTGYGREFKDMNIMDIGGGDLEDIVSGTEYLKSIDYVDPERIGIFGGSYGGYMTFWGTVKKPRMWKAGAASVGISDWKLLYDDSMPHFRYYLHRMFGKPEENLELYNERSPVHYVENIETPLLIIHGTHDPRCPVTQSRIFKEKLIETGWKEKQEGDKTFEYIEYSDIGHGGYTDQEFRIRSFKAILNFFKRRL